MFFNETMNPHPNPNFYRSKTSTSGYVHIFKDNREKNRRKKHASFQQGASNRYILSVSVHPEQKGGVRNAHTIRDAHVKYRVEGTNFQVLSERAENPEKSEGGVHLRGMCARDTPWRVSENLFGSAAFHGPPIKLIFESPSL